MSIIIVYGASGGELHHEQYPDWTFAALQKLARNWMRATRGQRYAIISAGQRYDSKARKGARR